MRWRLVIIGGGRVPGLDVDHGDLDRRIVHVIAGLGDHDGADNHEGPTIAGISVAPNGRVDMAWYDMGTDGLYNPNGRGDTARRDQTCWDVYMASSFDGGRTVAKNVRVSDRTMNQNSGFALNLAYDLRAPIGVLATDTTTYVTWPDSRSGTFALPTEDTYIATVIHEQAEKGHDGGLDLTSVFLGSAVGLLVAGLAVFAVSRRRTAPAAS